MAATPETVLVLSGRHAALAATRALSAAGYRVIAGDGGEYSTLRHSRHCAEVWPHPSPRDGESFLAALVEFLERRPGITSVLPLQDRYVALLSAQRARLPESVVLAAVDGQVAETCLDKGRMYAMAADLGVPHAPILQAKDRSELIQAADDVGYPCVVRPAVFGGPMPWQLRAVACADRAALEGLFVDGPDDFGVMLVQRYVTGVRRNVWFAARDGRLLVSLHADALRTDRLDGTGILVEGVTVKPDLRLQGYLEALVGQLGYTGVGGAQFIVPVKGEPSFLEINPRPAGTGVPLQRHCGLDLTLAAVDLASGAAGWRPDPDFQYPVGRRMAWTSRDVYGLGMAVSRREVGPASALRWLTGALVAAVRADVHLVWDRQDPLPALVLYAHLVTLGPWRRSRRRG